MARSETYTDGRIPLSTFRADVDYALEEAHTPYGRLGVKVFDGLRVKVYDRNQGLRLTRSGDLLGTLQADDTRQRKEHTAIRH